jgi:transcriptional regulator GlxA family with amidase domain
MVDGPRRIIPVFVVVPPRALLLDIAGPMEVLRRANLEQESTEFVPTYIGPAAEVRSSTGLDLAKISPLPVRLPDDALLIVSGAVDEPLAGSVESGPEALAKIAATSPRNLSRLFNEHTGMSVTDYVNRMRIALARELITGSRLDMENVAERIGFSSARQFRRAWRRLHDTPPGHVRAPTRS